MSPLTFIDCNRYPIDALETPACRTLLAHAKGELAKVGACELPGFVTPAGVQRAIVESSALVPAAYLSRSRGTVYLDDADPSLPPDHARRLVQHSSVGVIAYDQIPRTHLIRELYESPVLMAFIAAVLELPQLYYYADPLGALNIAVMHDGDSLGWHFDQTDFVTSIPLVPSDGGGAFEFFPLIRDENDDCVEAVREAILGQRQASSLAMTPGSLLLFKGRHTLHRVSTIEGKTARLIALLAYDRKPGTNSTAALKRARYGRTEAMPA